MVYLLEIGRVECVTVCFGVSPFQISPVLSGSHFNQYPWLRHVHFYPINETIKSQIKYM